MIDLTDMENTIGSMIRRSLDRSAKVDYGIYIINQAFLAGVLSEQERVRLSISCYINGGLIIHIDMYQRLKNFIDEVYP